MKNFRFFLIPLLFVCGVLLISLLLHWIVPPSKERTAMDGTEAPSQTQAGVPAYIQWQLPEGAQFRLGKGSIKDIKFAPDGSLFAVATSIGIWLYDTHTGAEVALLNEKPRNVTTLAFSPDGKTLLSGDSTGAVKLWDIPARQSREAFQGPGKITNALAVLSVEGIKLVNEAHGHIRVWASSHKTSQQIVTDIHANDRFGHLIVMALSPDGRFLAAAERGDSKIFPIHVWDVDTGDLLFTLKAHTRWIRALAFSPDSKTLASGDEYRVIRLWNIETGTHRATFKVATGSFHALAFSPNGKLLASGGGDGSVRLWDATVKNGEGNILGQYIPSLTVKGHKGRVSALAFSPDSKTFISGSYTDENIYVWDTTTGSKRFTCQGHFGYTYGLVFSETRDTLTSVHRADWRNIQLKVWDLSTGSQLSNDSLNIDGAFGAISPNGQTIVSHEYSEHNRTQLWDVNVKRGRSSLKGLPKRRRIERGTLFQAGFTFSPDSKTVASGGADNVVRVWDAAIQHRSGFQRFFAVFTGGYHPRLTIQGQPVHVRTLAFSPDEKILAGGSNGGFIHLWNAHTGTELFTLRGHRNRISALAFSPDGKTLAGGNRDGEISLWHTVNGTQSSANLLTPRATVNKLLFSQDGKILVSGDSSGTLYLWDVQTGRLLGTHIGHTNPIQALLLSADGKTLVSGGSDGTILLWDWEHLKKTDDR